MDGCLLCIVGACIIILVQRILNEPHSAVVGNKPVIAGKNMCLARIRLK